MSQPPPARRLPQEVEVPSSGAHRVFHPSTKSSAAQAWKAFPWRTNAARSNELSRHIDNIPRSALAFKVVRTGNRDREDQPS